MGSIKSASKKKFLSKKLRQNRRIPIFAIAKTGRKLTRNPKTRNWRHQKIKKSKKMKKEMKK
ncbi:MAG: 50S ribosomal protein L39e [Candidatus Micrarchaeota archaeon]